MKLFEGATMIDCNTFIGHWAFRRLRHNDAAGVLGMMDQFGFERACAASADAILYKDCQAGNEQLFEETAGHLDRFCLYATLNPAYPGWERDLRRCIDLGFSALRLYPQYHAYDLTGPEAGKLLDAAAEAGLPVSIPGRIVDRRQRHWMDTAEDLNPLKVIEVAEAHRSATFLLTEAIVGAPRDSDLWTRIRDLNLYLEISRMTSCLDANLQVALESLGAGRLLLGTGFPFKTPSPAFLKVQLLDASQDDKERIAGLNALHLFERP